MFGSFTVKAVTSVAPAQGPGPSRGGSSEQFGIQQHRLGSGRVLESCVAGNRVQGWLAAIHPALFFALGGKQRVCVYCGLAFQAHLFIKTFLAQIEELIILESLFPVGS